MILAKRESEIITLVNEQGAVSVRELAGLYQVAEITIRRDLKKLEALNLLRRTHGGATRLDERSGKRFSSGAIAEAEVSADALILAPVQGHAAHTLHERALRSHIPLIAE